MFTNMLGSSSRAAGLAATLAIVVFCGLPGPAVASPGETTRESVSDSGAQGVGQSGLGSPAISGDGLVTAFVSGASNLVAADTNFTDDVFVRDRTAGGAGTLTRVSVASDGTQANGASRGPAISADGRQVAFGSNADNLVAGDTNATTDVFVRDRDAGRTVRVSVPSDGTGGGGSTPSISADGRYVSFTSGATNLVPGDTNGVDDVFVYDRDTDKNGVFDEPGKTGIVRVSVANDGTEAGGFNFSSQASISASGRYVAFASFAASLVTGDNNGAIDVFVRDRDVDGNGVFDEPGAGKTATTRVSVTSAGMEGNGGSGDNSAFAISGDGTQVAFQSFATNLVAGDTNGQSDVFVRDRTAPKTARVSVASDGTQSNGFSSRPSLSGDGRLVSFFTTASNLAGASSFQVVVHDRDADTNGSFDGAGAGATTTTVESVASDGTPGNNGASPDQSISADGSRLVFNSSSTNLVPDDTNGVQDVFAHRLSAPGGMRSLRVRKDGSGDGRVTSSPAGIDCGSVCSKDFPTDTRVTLTAAPGSGSAFVGFSGGGCSGAATSCVVTLDLAKTVTATFAPAGGGGGNPQPPGGGASPPPPGGGAVSPPSGGAVPDTLAPGLSGLGLTNNPFVVAGSTPTFGVAAKAKAHKKGTTLRYTLSEAATVRIVITQSRSGRRKGKRCVAPTRKLRKAKKCTRISVKGTLTRTSHTGANRVAFSGRIGSKALAPGRYQATLTATDAANNASKPRTVAFTIVRR